jgi:hypothetical protein
MTKFKTKENCGFYCHLKEQLGDISSSLNYNSFKVQSETIKLINSNLCYFEVKHFFKEEIFIYYCKIYAFKFGIFRIIIEDLKGNRYKNKSDIGEELEPYLEMKMEVLNDRLILEINQLLNFEDCISHDKSGILSSLFSQDSFCTFKLIINYENFIIDYLINDIHISTLNKQSKLFCPSGQNYNSVDLTMINTKYVYGLPERLSEFTLRDDSYRLFNLDVFDQEPGSPQSLYGSIPMLHGVSSQGKCDILNSCFINNSSEIWVDVKSKNSDKISVWMTEGGIIDIYLTSDFNFYRNFYKWAKITGFSILPGIFAMGYHQCRWGYLSQKEIEEIDEKMNYYKIPYDFMWLDIDVS